MLSLRIPTIIGMVVAGLYNSMHYGQGFRWTVHQRSCNNGAVMGAVSGSCPFRLINPGVSTLIGAGAASVQSRAIGKRNQNITLIRSWEIWQLQICSWGLSAAILDVVFTCQLLALSIQFFAMIPLIQIQPDKMDWVVYG